MDNQRQSIIIIVPAFNEEGTIENVLNSLREAKEVSVIDDFVIVNDGSTDRTAEIVEKFGSHLINLNGNLGKSAAIEAGINYCEKKSPSFVVFFDADTLDITPVKIRELIEPLRRNSELSMIVANQIEGKNEKGYGEEAAIRYNGIRAFRFERLLAAYHDKNNWDPFVSRRKYPEAGLFLLFSKKETGFLPNTTFHNREMVRGSKGIFVRQDFDINAVQEELNTRKEPHQMPPRFRW